MQRLGFTLIEMMISIVLLGMIVLFLTATLGDMRKSKVLLDADSAKSYAVGKMLTLLQNDILHARTLSLKRGESNAKLSLHTNSSLYDMQSPYVEWFLDPTQGNLIRSESATQVSAPYEDQILHKVHLDIATKGCEWFKPYQAEDNRSIFINLYCGKQLLSFQTLLLLDTSK